MRTLLVFMLWYISTFRRCSSNFDCIVRESERSGTGDDDISSIGCNSSYPTMTSCGCRTHDDYEDDIDGCHTNSNVTQCIAVNGAGGNGIYAIARCCKFPSRAQNIKCTASKTQYVHGDDRKISITCNQSSVSNEYLTGCSASSGWSAIDGGYPDYLDPYHSTCAPNTDCPMDGNCTAHNGMSDGGNGGDGTRAELVCCDSPNYAIQCVTRYGKSVNAARASSYTFCGDDYTMTGCSGFGLYRNMNAWYIDENDFCIARTFKDYPVFAIGICCKLATDSPTTVPTIEPTTEPTFVPTIEPTTEPTVEPTIDPTMRPTTNPTVEPTHDPSTNPSIEPTIGPTSDPTTDPTIDPTLDPTRDPTVDPTFLYISTIDVVRLPSHTPTNVSSLPSSNVAAPTIMAIAGDTEGTQITDIYHNALFWISIVSIVIIIICSCILSCFVYQKRCGSKHANPDEIESQISSPRKDEDLESAALPSIDVREYHPVSTQSGLQPTDNKMSTDDENEDLLNLDENVLFEMEQIASNTAYSMYSEIMNPNNGGDEFIMQCTTNDKSKSQSNSNNGRQNNSNSHKHNNEGNNNSNTGNGRSSFVGGGNGGNGGGGGGGKQNNNGSWDDKFKDEAVGDEEKEEEKKEIEEHDVEEQHNGKLNVKADEFYPNKPRFQCRKKSSLTTIDEEWSKKNNSIISKSGLSLDPRVRARGIIYISRTLTQITMPSQIKETMPDIYSFMDKSIALLSVDIGESKIDIGESVILNYNFHDAITNEILYCIIERQNELRNRGYRWKMLETLFTANDIENKYQIKVNQLPNSIYSNCLFLDGINNMYTIEDILQTESLRSIIALTDWNKLNVFSKQNNKQRICLYITKQEFVKRIEIEMINNMNNKIKLIPIILFNDKKDIIYNYVFVQIIRIHTNIDIGISYEYNKETDRIQPIGIHLDKDQILQQHQLSVPQHMNECHCLDNFISNINAIKIGELNQEENYKKDLKKKCVGLKEKNQNLIHKNQGLLKENKILRNDKRNIEKKCCYVEMENISLRKENEKLQTQIIAETTYNDNRSSLSSTLYSTPTTSQSNTNVTISNQAYYSSYYITPNPMNHVNHH